MLAAEQAAALAAMQSSKLSKERSDALMYYNGDMSQDMPAEDGRSQAVSTDVLDTIEGLLPSLLEIFCGSDEVVRFTPIGAEDVAAAEQETDYVNHVLMNQNPGFMVLYSFIKDALLSKVGIVKVWWQDREEEENEIYTGLSDDAYAILQKDDDVEITEDKKKDGLHDVKVTKSKKFAECKVLGVPPEEFGIEKTARSIRDCNYCFHRVIKSEAELIAEGFDEDQIRELPTYMAITNTEEINRDTVFEHQNVGEDANQAARRLEISEHYVRMDYEGNGKACLYKVTTGGSQAGGGGTGEILRKDGKDDITEFDQIPFAAMTPIPVTHRFFGKSMADMTKDIQQIKTALLRAMLDNAYLAVNPRVEVAETFANENTLDDLLVSRPGGIVRTKNPGGIQWQEVPTVGSFVLPLLEHQDQIRETRTGVTRQGQALDPDTLANQSATATNIMFTMAQARMRLIARIFAETGIKDLMTLIHATIRKHGQEAQTIKLRGNWVTVDPREWKKRDHMTVEVGLGTGGKAEQMALIGMIGTAQEKMLMGGLTNIVTPTNLYNSAKALTRIAGHKDVDAFFTDPTTQPPPQAPQDPKLQIEMMKLQQEDKKQQADQAHQTWKMQADAALEQQKFEHDKQIALLEAGIKERESQHKMQIESHKAELNAQSAQHQLQIEAMKAQLSNSQAAEKHNSEMAMSQQKHGQDMSLKQADIAHRQSQAEVSAAPLNEIRQHLKSISAPRRIKKNKDGSWQSEIIGA